jgi:hypothetical protein
MQMDNKTGPDIKNQPGAQALTAITEALDIEELERRLELAAQLTGELSGFCDGQYCMVNRNP